jgi:hypothetical protein
VVYVELCKLAGVYRFFYKSPDDGGVSRGGQVPGGAGAALLRIWAAMFSNLNPDWSRAAAARSLPFRDAKLTPQVFG